MSRGYIFQITTDIATLPNLDETSFYNLTEALGIDYVANCNEMDAKTQLVKFANQLHSAGFETNKNNPTPNHCAFVITTGNRDETVKAQCNWFKSRLNRFKSLAEAITLNEFSTPDGSGIMLDIQNVFHNRYGDAIYFDMGTGSQLYTMDQFIRSIQPDTKYYVEFACVYMH